MEECVEWQRKTHNIMDPRIKYLLLHSVGCCLQCKLHNSFSREKGFFSRRTNIEFHSGPGKACSKWGDVVIDPHNIEMFWLFLTFSRCLFCWREIQQVMQLRLTHPMKRPSYEESLPMKRNVRNLWKAPDHGEPQNYIQTHRSEIGDFIILRWS